VRGRIDTCLCAILAWGCGSTGLSGVPDGWHDPSGEEPEPPCIPAAGEPVPIELPDPDPGMPDLVWTGSGYGVVWHEPDLAGSDVLLARLDRFGHVVDSVVVQQGAHSAAFPAMAWTGSEYGIVWVDFGAGDEEIFFARFDAEARRVIDDVPVTRDPMTSHKPDIAWTGSEFGVVWTDNRVSGADCTMMHCAIDTFFTRLSAEGVEQGEEVRLSDESYHGGGDYNHAWIAWTGSVFGVFSYWMFHRVDPLGVELGEDGRLSLEPYNVPPVWTGSGYGVLSCPAGDDRLHLDRLDPLGVETSDAVIDSAEHVWEYALAWTGSGYGAVWEAGGAGEGLHRFCLVEAGSGSCEPAVLEGVDLLGEAHRAMAWTGSGFGLVWTRFREGLFFTHIDVCP
jgi:hypothetical protein